MLLIYPIRDICNLKLSVWNDLLLELKSSELLLRLHPAACQRSHRDFALTFYQVKAQCTFRCRSHDLTFGIPLGEKDAQPRKHETPLCRSNTCNHTLLQPVLQMFALFGNSTGSTKMPTGLVSNALNFQQLHNSCLQLF